MRPAFTLLLIGFAFQSFAQQTYNISDLRWLSGNWKGQGLGGNITECWSEPEAGTMVAYFRLTAGSKHRVYEFVTIEQTDTVITYYFKHYSLGMKPWETEPLVYYLQSLDDKQAVFEARAQVKGKPRKLVYTLTAPDALNVKVVGWEKTDKGEESFFELDYTK